MSEKQHNILPTTPIEVFAFLVTQEGDLLLTQSFDFLGLEETAYIDQKQYIPTLVEKPFAVTLDSKSYIPTLTEKIIEPTQVSYLLTSEGYFLRTQDGNFIIL